MSYRPTLPLEAIWSGDLATCEAGGHKLLLARIGDTVHAYEDRCAHLGLPLSRGGLEGGRLICFAHRWEYDVATGKGINPSSVCLRRFDVRVEAGTVLVDIPEERE